MPDTWFNAHSHSIFSFLDGHSKPGVYAERAKELGMSAIATTDHGNIHSWPDFYDTAKEYDLKPVLGIEAYQAREHRFSREPVELASGADDELEQRGPYHLTILARNHDGYQSLIKLSSRAYTEGLYQKPRMDFELLEEHREGLVVLSGCLSGGVAQALLREDKQAAMEFAAKTQDIVGKDNYFIEVMDHAIDEERQVIGDLVDIAKKIDAKVIPSGDTHYVRKDDSYFHDVMMCVSTGSKVDEEDRFKFSEEEFYLRSREEMLQRFSADLLDNTLYLVDMMEDFELDRGTFYFPEFDVPTDESLEEHFDRLVVEGLKWRYGEKPRQEVLDRAKYEMRVIKELDFPSYFLVIADLVRWAKGQGIRVGPGRGSAAGSIVSYALDITNLCPLDYGLLFERFLIPERVTMPDIDIDFDDRRRGEVIDYAKRKYGEERVAHIGTFQTTGAKQAIRDAARVLDYEYSRGDQLSKKVPAPVLGVSKSIDESLESKEFAKAANDTDNKRIIDAARGLEGIIRQTGTHAAGVVIARSDVTDYIPVMKRTGEEENDLITQWDMGRVEEFGQLKIDFLGLGNLGVIDLCIENIRETRGEDVDIDNIPLDDPLTYQELCQGRSMGTFQLESSGLRQMMVALQPENIKDIMALIALYRPGPLGSGMDKTYIARKHGRDSNLDEVDHILLEMLPDSRGIILYQEDVLLVARELAGFSAAEADTLRKGVGKKIPEVVHKMKSKFIDGAKEVGIINARAARRLFDAIEHHAGYSFGRAHAASYAVISYQTSYLKFNYPAEYMAALLSAVKNQDEAGPYLSESNRMGINVLPPSLNRSGENYKVISDEEILFGLSSVKGLGPAKVKMLLDGRGDTEYESIYDFMRRCRVEILNKATLEHLLRSGCFDELVPEVPNRPISREEKSKILEDERDELGLFLTEHPLTGVWSIIEPQITTTIENLEHEPERSYVELGGIISKVDKKTTRKGDVMYILGFEDLTGSVEVIVFPNMVKDYNFSVGDVAILKGRVEHEGDDEHVISKLFFYSMRYPDLPKYATGEPIIIRCEDRPSYGKVRDMINIIQDHPGNSLIYLRFPDENREMSLQFKRTADPAVEDKLKALS